MSHPTKALLRKDYFPAFPFGGICEFLWRVAQYHCLAFQKKRHGGWGEAPASLEIFLASKKCLILILSCNSIFVQGDLHIACEQTVKLTEGQSFVEAPEKAIAKVQKSLHVQISRSPQEASGVVNETFRLFSACESHSSQTHHLNYGKKKIALSECSWHWVSWDLKGQCQSNLPICIPFL